MPVPPTTAPTSGQIVATVMALYRNASRPMHLSRADEFRAVHAVMVNYGIDLTDADFDEAIAKRLGDGAEYEWPRA